MSSAFALEIVDGSVVSNCLYILMSFMTGSAVITKKCISKLPKTFSKTRLPTSDILKESYIQQKRLAKRLRVRSSRSSNSSLTLCLIPNNIMTGRTVCGIYYSLGEWIWERHETY